MEENRQDESPRRDPLSDLEGRVEEAINEARPKVRRALRELDARLDSAVAELRPRVENAMDEVRPRVDRFIAEVQPRLDTALQRIEARIAELRRDLAGRATRDEPRATTALPRAEEGEQPAADAEGTPTSEGGDRAPPGGAGA